MEKQRVDIKLATWNHVASLVKNGFWKFDAEWEGGTSSSPASYGTKDLDLLQQRLNANLIVILGYYSALFETSQVDVCKQSLNMLKSHAWRAADIDVQFEMISNIECAVFFLERIGERPHVQDLIDAKRNVRVRRG